MDDSKLAQDELLREQRDRPFVGREQECETFRRNFRNGEPEHLYFGISGEPGIGKSYLLERLQAIAREHGALAALTNEADVAASGDRSIVQAMSRLAQQLTQGGARLLEFSERVDRYHACMSTIAQDPQAPLGAFDHLGIPFSWLTVGAPRITHAGTVLDGPPQRIMSTTHQLFEQPVAWKSYLGRKFDDPGDLALIQRPVEILTPLFVRGLNALAEEKTLILCFDAWELLGIHLDGWLRQIVGKVGLSRGVWLVIAGTDELGSEWEPSYPLMARFHLEAFTRRESRIYLNWMGVTDRATQEEILSLSGGVPILISTMAGGERRSTEHGGSPVERHLASLDSARLRGIIVGCAAARRLDSQLLHEAAGGDESAPKVCDRLTRLPFVERRPAYWSYHPEIRRLMLGYSRRRSRADSRAVHVRLAAYHRDLLGGNGGSLRDLDEAGREHLLEAVYHGLMAEQPAGVAQGLETFLEALRDDLEFAGEVLATWSQAASEQESANDVTLWAARVDAALAALKEQDWQGLSRFCAMLRARDDLSAVEASMVALISGLCWHGLGRFDEAQREYTQALASGQLARATAACHYYRGKTRYITRDYAGAAGDLQTAIELGVGGDGAAGYHVSRGDAFMYLNDLDQAQESYDLGLGLRPDAYTEAALHNNRGTARLCMKLFEAAVADYDRALEFNPVNEALAATRASRALVCIRLGDWQRAIEDCDHALDLAGSGDPAAVALTIRALAHTERGDLESAIEDLNQALAADPADGTAAAVYTNLAYAHGQMGDLTQATQDYGQALRLSPASVTALYGRAMMHYATGHLDMAIADLTRTLELKPDEPPAYLSRGNAYLDSGKHVEAIGDYARFVLLEPEGSDAAAAYYNRATSYYALGQLEEAVADFGRTLQRKPKAAAVYHSRGVVWYELGEYAPALEDLNRAIDLGLRKATLYNNRGLAYAQLHDCWDAVSDFDDALALDPDAPIAAQIHLNRGTVYGDLQDLTRAIDDYDQAIELDPGGENSFIAVCRRGNAHYALGNYEQAIDDCDQALALGAQADDHAALYLLRADSHLGLGAIRQAVADYDRAINLLPETDASAMAFFNRGTAHIELGEYALALADLNRSLSLGLPVEPTVDALRARGVASAHLGDHEGAIRDLKRSIELEGQTTKSAMAYQQRGNSHFALGRHQQAICDYSLALELKTPDEPTCYANRGNAYAESGQRRRAMADYDRAMRLSPADATIYFNRGRVHLQLMEYEQAVAWYTKALELCGDGGLAAEIHSGRGSAYAGLGDYRPAIEDYGLALELEPGAETASILYTNSGFAYDKLQDHERAIEDYERAIELDPENAAACYSAACAYSLLWNPTEACRFLERAVALDERYRDKAAIEIDLRGIHDTECYRNLMGAQH